MSSNFVQGQDYTLASPYVIGGASLTFKSLLLPDNKTKVTMAMFGTIGYITGEPETKLEENFSFTGITQNGDGTATLTGVTGGLEFSTPYTQDLSLRRGHSAGSVFRFTNSVQLYSNLASTVNTETITNNWTFNSTTGRPKLSTDVDTAVPTEFIDLGQLQRTAIAGAPNASTVLQGLVQIPTQGQVNAGTGTGSTGALLTVRPTELAVSILTANFISAADAGGTDTYAITLPVNPVAYTTGQHFIFKANTVNTGTASLNVNGIGPITIVKNFNQTLENGDIAAGMWISVVYDGTNFQMVNQQATMPSTVNLTNISNTYSTGGFLTRDSFTYNETIAAGDLLKLINDAGTEKVEKIVGIYDQANATGHNNAIQRIKKLDNDKLILAYGSSVVVVSIASGVATLGTPVGLSGAGITTNDISLAIVDSGTFVVFRTGSGGTDNAIANVCTVSGTTITDVTSKTIATAGGNPFSTPSVESIGTGYLMFQYGNTGSNRYQVAVYTLSGTSIGAGASATDIIGVASVGISASTVQDFATMKSAVIYTDTNLTRVAPFTFTAPGTLTQGASTSINSFTSGVVRIKPIDSTHFMTLVQDSAPNVTLRTHNSTGSVISGILYSGVTNGDIYYEDNKITFIYGKSSLTTVNIIEVFSGANIQARKSYSFGIITPTLLQDNICSYNTRKIAVLRIDSGLDSYVTTGSFDFDRFIGIAAQAGNVAEVKNVDIFGGLNTHQSALTPNFRFFIDAEGAKTQTTTGALLSGAFTNFEIGRAMSATDVVINNLI